MTKVIQEIEKRIDEAKDDTIFLTMDFKDIAPISTIRKSLSRLVDSNKIIRLMDGMYYKSINISKPSVERIAEEIAREFRWTIAPSTKQCLFLLGLSNDSSNECSFINDGPNRNYQYNNETITFIHRSRKYITNLNRITIIFLEALRFLGKKNVNDTIISTLRNNISNSDKEIILKETKGINDWIYSIAKKLN